MTSLRSISPWPRTPLLSVIFTLIAAFLLQGVQGKGPQLQKSPALNHQPAAIKNPKPGDFKLRQALFVHGNPREALIASQAIGHGSTTREKTASLLTRIDSLYQDMRIKSNNAHPRHYSEGFVRVHHAARLNAAKRGKYLAPLPREDLRKTVLKRAQSKSDEATLLLPSLMKRLTLPMEYPE